MEVKVGSPYCENKTALHFPSEMMESALWIKICQLTNQPVKRASSKLYILVMSSLFQELIPFCNSAEAPSGVAVTQSESNLESTRSGDQRHPRMVLEESSIGSKESSAPTDQTAEETFDEDGTKEDIEEEDEEEESGESVDDETLGGDEEEESLDVVVEDEQESQESPEASLRHHQHHQVEGGAEANHILHHLQIPLSCCEPTDQQLQPGHTGF